MLTISKAKAIIKDNAWNTVMLTPPRQKRSSRLIKNLSAKIISQTANKNKRKFTYMLQTISPAQVNERGFCTAKNLFLLLLLNG